MTQKAGIAARVRGLGAGGIVLVAAALVALVAVGIAVRRSAPPEAPAPVTPARQPEPDGDRIGQLERRLRGDTTDAEGWSMLGSSYFEAGRYADAARAYGQAATIAPGDARYWSALGEATVIAGRAGVTPPADAAFRHALAIDPRDPRARYFIGIEKDMAGDHKGAIDGWIALLAEAPAGSPWAPDIRRLVAQVAAANHIDIAGRLPAEAPAPAAPDVAAATIPGPTREQIEGASRLPPAEQDGMVRAMVDRLAARLRSAPRDADGWIRLIRARMVLGDAAGARAALGTARTTFAGDATTLARLGETAKALGVPGA